MNNESLSRCQKKFVIRIIRFDYNDDLTIYSSREIKISLKLIFV